MQNVSSSIWLHSSIFGFFKLLIAGFALALLQACSLVIEPAYDPAYEPVYESWNENVAYVASNQTGYIAYHYSDGCVDYDPMPQHLNYKHLYPYQSSLPDNLGKMRDESILSKKEEKPQRKQNNSQKPSESNKNREVISQQLKENDSKCISEAMKEAENYFDKICEKVPESGAKNAEYSDVNVEAETLIARLFKVSLGADVARKKSTESGIAQEDRKELIKNRNECKLHIFNKISLACSSKRLRGTQE
ncbi:MAG: hypothetical protein G8345_02580 [Magnetococcales bacterium]|nr:hypothetical protein [Magnetococcales bacterium]NGZ25757.1 hypothetical protein [Magnetococcales bacterium]